MDAALIRRLLVPVDFSEPSANALRVAAVIAEKHQAAVTVLHAEVLEAPPYFTRGQIEALERERRTARAAAEAYIRTFARALMSQPIEAVVVDGNPIDAVPNAIPGHDLVVMGTHGRRAPARWWLGSVAEQVIRSTSTPVLVVCPGKTEPQALFQRVAWVDGVPAAGSAQTWAATLAGAFGGKAVHVPRPANSEAAREFAATLVVVAAPTDSHSTGIDQVTEFIRVCGRPVLFVPEPTSVSA